MLGWPTNQIFNQCLDLNHLCTNWKNQTVTQNEALLRFSLRTTRPCTGKKLFSKIMKAAPLVATAMAQDNES